MGTFSYKASTRAGTVQEGRLEASGRDDAIAALKAMGLVPLVVREGGEGKHRKGLKNKRVTRQDILNVTSQLASLLRAKLPLAKALSAVENQTPTAQLKKLVGDIGSMVGSGKSLSEALSEYPRYFPELYVSMVKAGEVGGILDGALAKVSEMLERDEMLKSRIKGALTYPAVMFAVMIISVIVLITFVVPRFMGVFTGMGGTLPLPTRVLVTISSVFQKWWWLMAAVAGSAFFGGWQYMKNERGRSMFDRIKLTLPMVGDLNRELAVSRFALTLGSLLESGVPMVQAMAATRDVAGNRHVGLMIDGIIQEVKEGRSLSESLADRSDFFPSLVTGMVGTGEESGNLSEMLNNAGTYYMRETDGRIKALTTLLEPAIILLMGCMVGFIIIAMLLPIFEMTMMVK